MVLILLYNGKAKVIEIVRNGKANGIFIVI